MADVKPKPEFEVITAMTCVGPILGMTILLETGDIRRFQRVAQ